MATVAIVLVAVAMVGLIAWGVYFKKKARGTRKNATIGEEVVTAGENTEYEMENIGLAEQVENVEQGDLGLMVKVREMV